MKTTLFVFLLFLGSSSVIAQATAQIERTFVIFGVGTEHTEELKQLETLLRNSPDFEMVRVEYANNIAFVVSNYGVEINDNLLMELSGNLYQNIKCKQYGVQGKDVLKFDELYECLSNEN